MNNQNVRGHQAESKFGDLVKDNDRGFTMDHFTELLRRDAKNFAENVDEHKKDTMYGNIMASDEMCAVIKSRREAAANKLAGYEQTGQDSRQYGD